jgi:hypothetical protein
MASIKYIGILLLFSISVNAQSFSFSDLFGQANKQKTYYMQQIAAYNALESEIKMGYGVMKNGLGGIANINTAELNAHTAFYNSLKTPSSAVKNNTQVKDILNYQTYISNAFSQSYTGFTSDEANYVVSVKTQILSDCNKDLNDLQTLLTAGKLQMSDDERLKRMSTIHAAMLDKYQFTQSFTNSLKLLALGRQQSANDTQTLQSLYENH